ncbi:protein lin-9 [Paragonimus westermani]|uniref:Protein lin-9 n=1 Tax=Paragonimus westermani TaxID=34504 RepID=A0A5J4NBV1_9TREM|nr:protein lin-9 [Paragonimus westermani]
MLREIFSGCNDFQIILREHFPTLKTRSLLRGQWAIIRRMIGRPRRFSATFLAEERGSVQGKRRNLHYLQQVTLTGSLGPMASEHLDTLLTCLPATTRIPPRLPVGTRVCTRYHFIENLFSNVEQSSAPGLRMTGLFTNSRLVDTTNVRTDYDATPLPSSGGPLLSDSVCTTECPMEPNGHPSLVTDNLLVSSLKQHSDAAASCSFDLPVPHSVDPQSNMFASLGRPAFALLHVDCTSDTSGVRLSQSFGSIFTTLFTFPSAPVAFSLIYSQAKLYKLLDDKRVSIAKLKTMNDTAEIKLSENHNNITVQFQHSYATLILYLDKLNQELKHHMDVVLMHVAKIAQDQNMMHLSYLIDWRRRCDDEAQEMVSRIKMAQRRLTLDDCKVDLVVKLTCLLIHLCVSSTCLPSTFRLISYLQNLSDQRIIGQTLTCVEDLLKEIRGCLHPSNVQCFELTVEHFVGEIIHAVTNAYHSCFQSSYPFVAQSQPAAPTQMTYPDNMTCM